MFLVSLYNFLIRYAVRVVHVFILTNKALHDWESFSVKQREQNNWLLLSIPNQKMFLLNNLFVPIKVSFFMCKIFQ